MHDEEKQLQQNQQIITLLEDILKQLVFNNQVQTLLIQQLQKSTSQAFIGSNN